MLLVLALVSSVVFALVSWAVLAATSQGRRSHLQCTKRIFPSGGQSSASNKPALDVRLCAVDQMLVCAWVPHALQFDTILNLDVLCKALALALDEFPILCSRLENRDDGVHAVGCFGVPVSVYKRDGKPPGHQSSNSEWSALTPKGRWPAPAKFMKDDLMLVYVTFFENGSTVLGICTSHALVDASSAYTFLRRWSQLCGEIQKQPTTTTFLPPVPNERTIQPSSKIQSKHDLVNTCPYVHSPLHRLGYPAMLARLLWGFATNVQMEFRIDGEALAQCKKEIMQALPDGEWVSTYEVIVTMWFKAMSLADASTSSLPARIITNMRKRTPNFSNGSYFGNATSDGLRIQAVHCEGDDWLVEGTRKTHERLREGLANGDKLQSSHEWWESVRAVAGGGSLFWSGSTELMQGEALMVNTWCAHRWLDIDMGTYVPATALGCVIPALRNFLVMYPRNHNNDITMTMALPATTAARFRTVIKTLNLPFDEVH